MGLRPLDPEAAVRRDQAALLNLPLVQDACPFEKPSEFRQRWEIAPIADALTKRGIATLNVQYRVVGEPGGGFENRLH